MNLNYKRPNKIGQSRTSFLWLFVVPQALATLINQFESRTNRLIHRSEPDPNGVCTHEGWTAAACIAVMEKRWLFCSDTTTIFVCCRSLARYLSGNYISTSQNKIKFGGSGVVGCGGVGWGEGNKLFFWIPDTKCSSPKICHPVFLFFTCNRKCLSNMFWWSLGP